MNVSFPYDHNEPKDSQVIICCTGTPKEIMESLTRIMDDFIKYKKPIQGTVNSSGGSVMSVKTPVWGGKPY